MPFLPVAVPYFVPRGHSSVLDPEFADSLVFEGGTFLSKVFGVMERFSEDVDLSISPEFLKLPPAGVSRNQAGKMENAVIVHGHEGSSEGVGRPTR